MASRASLQTFRQRVPLIISAVIVLIFAFYLAQQINDWLQLTRTTQPAANQSSQPAGVAPDMQRIESLFGTTQVHDYAPGAADLGLTLLGSFVHADPARSTAIIQVSGSPPQLYRIDEELESGVSLKGVHPDRVEILRAGRIESVMFPSTRSMASEAHSLPDYGDSSDMNQPDPQAELLQQQMEALRLQMEGPDSPPENFPSDESPTEDD